MNSVPPQFDLGQLLENLRVFDDWFDVDQMTVPAVVPSVMVLVLPPYVPIPIPVPTLVSLSIPIVRFGTSAQTAAPEDGPTPVPLEIITE